MTKRCAATLRLPPWPAGGFLVVALLLAACAREVAAAGAPRSGFFQVDYEGSTNRGELAFGVMYRIWIPPNVSTLRGIVVHQHGCGEGACKGGETAADDLHWQALARKWNCALLGPSYHQPEQASCALWCDPRNGSDQAFLRALTDLSGQTGHPEIERIPWALWGHSGGANWVGTMLLLHPERVLAVWLRSGSPRLIASSGNDIPIPAAALLVPVMCNLGIKEKEGRFARIWTTTEPFFRDLRAKGGLAGFAVDPRTSHECGDSRCCAIPFFDACLAQRLPRKAGVAGPLSSMDARSAWLASMQGGPARPAAQFTGDVKESIWLPNAQVAKAWSEYIKTGATTDATPPAAPGNVRISAGGDLTWDAEADLESGLGGFIVERDGEEIARIPQKPLGRFGRPLFQQMSYHDTPERPLPAMRFTDPGTERGHSYTYRVIAINGAGLLSKPSAAVRFEMRTPGEVK